MSDLTMTALLDELNKESSDVPSNPEVIFPEKQTDTDLDVPAAVEEVNAAFVELEAMQVELESLANMIGGVEHAFESCMAGEVVTAADVRAYNVSVESVMTAMGSLSAAGTLTVSTEAEEAKEEATAKKESLIGKSVAAIKAVIKKILAWIAGIGQKITKGMSNLFGKAKAKLEKIKDSASAITIEMSVPDSATTADEYLAIFSSMISGEAEVNDNKMVVRKLKFTPTQAAKLVDIMFSNEKKFEDMVTEVEGSLKKAEDELKALEGKENLSPADTKRASALVAKINEDRGVLTNAKEVLSNIAGMRILVEGENK